MVKRKISEHRLKESKQVVGGCFVDWLLMVCLVAAYKGWGKRWATVEQEARDEVHDAEILRAVQESMAAWTQRRSSHRYVYCAL